MPSLACRTCGRLVYATVPLDELFMEERWCTRCGAMLQDERRAANRRRFDRRGTSLSASVGTNVAERRAADRRQRHRRQGDARTYASFAAF